MLKKQKNFQKEINTKKVEKSPLSILTILSIIFFITGYLLIGFGVLCALIGLFSLSNILTNSIWIFYGASLLFSISSLVLAIISLVKYVKEKKKGNFLPKFIFVWSIVSIISSSYCIVCVVYSVINALTKV